MVSEGSISWTFHRKLFSISFSFSFSIHQWRLLLILSNERLASPTSKLTFPFSSMPTKPIMMLGASCFSPTAKASMSPDTLMEPSCPQTMMMPLGRSAMAWLSYGSTAPSPRTCSKVPSRLEEHHVKSGSDSKTSSTTTKKHERFNWITSYALKK